MTNSQTVKKTLFLAGRVPEELKKRFNAARKVRGWNAQVALERAIEFWVSSVEAGAGPSGAGTQRGEGEDELKKEGGGYHHSPTAKRGRLLDEDKSKDMIRGNRQGRP